jgi:hypothetical protein
VSLHFTKRKRQQWTGRKNAAWPICAIEAAKIASGNFRRQKPQPQKPQTNNQTEHAMHHATVIGAARGMCSVLLSGDDAGASGCERLVRCDLPVALRFAGGAGR